MAVKKVSIEDLARSVLFSDKFNQDVSMLDMMHVFEITLKNVGVSALVDGAVDIDLGNSAVIRCTIAPRAASL
jgi:hypothetical protein